MKDKMAGGNIEIQYEPTVIMWCDILTKPERGSVFRKFRAHLMKLAKEYDDEAERLLPYPNLLPRVILLASCQKLTRLY